MHAGHVLVAPQRTVARFSDMDSDEVSDLWQLVHTVAKCIEAEHEAHSMSLVMQVCVTI
jgi:diadenosine tetraphosphate (Ap4A) HIT family hydrolase